LGRDHHRVALDHLQAAARALSLSLNAMQVHRHTEVEAAILSIRKQASQALVVSPSSMLVPRWIADLALKNGLPLASTSSSYAYEGGLMSYSDDWDASFDRVAGFVDRILRGAKPADLPVELPTKFKLIVNAKTARALGLDVPPSIMIRADSVIQ
jgi:putative ABC transport system substrate-binding protein